MCRKSSPRFESRMDSEIKRRDSRLGLVAKFSETPHVGSTYETGGSNLLRVSGCFGSLPNGGYDHSRVNAQRSTLNANRSEYAGKKPHDRSLRHGRCRKNTSSYQQYDLGYGWSNGSTVIYVRRRNEGSCSARRISTGGQHSIMWINQSRVIGAVKLCGLSRRFWPRL